MPIPYKPRNYIARNLDETNSPYSLADLGGGAHGLFRM